MKPGQDNLSSEKLFKSTRERGFRLYMVLAALFVATLVVCNLIANKFVTVDLGFHTFVISAGVLPYPLTFLITDLLSEIYGRKRTSQVVYSGFFALALVLFVLYLGHSFDAIENSPINNEQFDEVFANSWRVICSSMIAYLVAQLVDVRLFHFWKKLTYGRHLWLRNNASTVLSQGVDTSLVVIVLFAGVESFNTILQYIISGWLFKILCAFVDTPLFYLGTYLARRNLNLKINEELDL